MPTTEDETKEQEENDCIKVIGNELLFYGDVDRENTLEFVEKFKKLEIELLKKMAELVGYEPMIRVHIMSEGGDVYAGLNMMNVLERSRVKVVTIAQGACCSAATFVLLGGSERRMGRNAYLLIHQISTEMWGSFNDLKHELKSTDKLMKMLKDMYLSKTKIPEAKFKSLMKKDIYLPPDKCLKYGIVSEIE
jgi:ATP-dependent protease ClpP protease subunit|tara:strand:- start:473 stop:1048 length:576 start_codon:yes stop_codon:yes gene_type:complete